MTHHRKIALAVSLALIIAIPFSLRSLQAASPLPSASASGAQAVQLTSGGWQQAPAPIPNQTIPSLEFSSGASSWTVGSSVNPSGGQSFGYSGSDGAWQSTAMPFSSLATVFTPSYPETGMPNTGWLQELSGSPTIAYFNGRNFQAPYTFSNAIELSLFSSQGNVWAVSNLGVSSMPAGSTEWSSFKALGNLQDNTYLMSAAASGSHLYVLGLTVVYNHALPAYNLVAVDANGNVTNVALPASISGTPVYTVDGLSARLFAENNTVFVFLPTTSGPNNYTGYAFYSINSGATWHDVSVGLPVLNATFFDENVSKLMTMVNGMVILPPLEGNGVYLNLTQVKQVWMPYVLPNNLEGNLAYSLPSSDGHQQCLYQAAGNPPAIACYDFIQRQWISVASLQSSNINFITGVVTLGNNKIAAIGENSNGDGLSALYYDGQDWATPVSYPNVPFFQFGVSALPYVDPNGVWIFGQTMSGKNAKH